MVYPNSDKEKMMRQQPAKADFTVNRKDASVDVLFKPTTSHYSFQLLADPDDIAKHGPVSPSVLVRHAGRTGDTDRYDADAVQRMAHQLATEAVS